VNNTLKDDMANRERYQGASMLITHELQGPVTVILGCTSMLRDETLPAESRKTALDMIEGQARGMSSLVHSLMGTLDRGPERKEGRERFDAHELAADVVSRLRGQAELEGAAIQPLVTGERPPVLVEAGPERVRCILSNLIRNGLAYSVRPAHVFVETRNLPRGDRVEIAVHDYGLGIPGSEHERIFEAGTRLSEEIPGFGHGLHLSRKLAEHEGGSLRLEWSEPLKGSVFVLSLPRASARPPQGMGVLPSGFQS
jgi:signal transduction histidine kinase